jgi:hypothetical protein
VACPERSRLLHKVQGALQAYNAALIAMRRDRLSGPPADNVRKLAEAPERAWNEFRGHIEGHHCGGARAWSETPD